MLPSWGKERIITSLLCGLDGRKEGREEGKEEGKKDGR